MELEDRVVQLVVLDKVAEVAVAVAQALLVMHLATISQAVVEAVQAPQAVQAVQAVVMVVVIQVVQAVHPQVEQALKVTMNRVVHGEIVMVVMVVA